MSHAFSTAINFYDQISQRDPLAHVAAQTNATRAAAWQLLLTATHGSPPGQHSLSQLAERTIKRAAQAVENAHQYRAEIDRDLNDIFEN